MVPKEDSSQGALCGGNPGCGGGEQPGKDRQRRQWVTETGLVLAKQAQSSAAVWGREEGEQIFPPCRISPRNCWGVAGQELWGAGDGVPMARAGLGHHHPLPAAGSRALPPPPPTAFILAQLRTAAIKAAMDATARQPHGGPLARPHLFGVHLANASVRTSCELAPSTWLAPSTHPKTSWGSQSSWSPRLESPLNHFSLGLICAPKNKGIKEKMTSVSCGGFGAWLPAAPGGDALMSNIGLNPLSTVPTAPTSPAPFSSHLLYPCDFDPLVKFVLDQPRS